MTYLESLSGELARVGITGRLRRRILLEFEDHLRSDPAAELGAPAQLASQFSDELGTVRARRGAFVAFGALALAGALFALAFLGYGPAGAGPAHGHARSPVLGSLALAMAAIGAQVAFVSGVLAALRAFRRRRALVVARPEATVISRRASVALLGGLVSMAGLALIALEFQRGVDPWWQPAALVGAAVGACALLVAAPAVIASLRVRPSARGAGGDIFDDLGLFVPTPLRGHPWAFAVVVAAAVALLITAVGVVADDPYDGALRGVADGLACLAGFALLGGYLGLRAAGSPRGEVSPRTG